MTTRAQRQVALNGDVRGANFLYGPEQRRNWTETDWNWHIRKAIQLQGYRTFHIREASETGIADLIVYSWREMTDAIEVNAWLELKKDNTKADSNFPAGQREFMRDHWRLGRNAMFVMFDRKVDMLAVHQGDLKGRVKMYPADSYLVNWQEVIAHFKTRKVSL